MDTFVYKAVVLLTGTVLLFVSPHHAFGQVTAWRTNDAEAIVDVATGDRDTLTIATGTAPPLIKDNDTIEFRNAEHVLTITDGGTENTGTDAVTILGNITTVNRGGGTLIFDLKNSGTNLTVGNIGTSANRVTTVEIQNSGGDLIVGNVFAGTLTVSSGQALTSSGIINVVTLGGSGTIDTGSLRVNQGLFDGDITTTGDFTANLTGNLHLTGMLTVGGDAEFTGNGRADLDTIQTADIFTIDSDVTVALNDIRNSSFNPNHANNVVNGKLEVYGDAPLNEITFTTEGDGSKVVDTSIFTQMDIRTPGTGGAGTTTIGTNLTHLPQARMSDGFLAAMTIHQRYTAWNAVHDRLITGGRNDGRSAWFNGIGRHSNHYRSSFNHQNWKTVMGGGQIGIDLFKTRHFQSGLLFGYEEGESKNDRDRLKAQDFYFGLYGACVFRNGADARIVFAQGWQSYKLNRQGNGNVLYTASFNGGTSEANFELGKRLGWGEWSLRPVLATDIFHNNLKAAQEAGIGTERIAYGQTDFTQVFFRTGTDLRHQTRHYTLNSGIYYAYDMNGAELRTHAWDATDRTLNAPLVGTKLGDSLLMFNLGIEFEVFTDFSISVGYLGEYAMGTANNALQSIGTVGFVGKW